MSLTIETIIAMSNSDVATALLQEWRDGGEDVAKNIQPLGGLIGPPGGAERYGAICALAADMVADDQPIMKTELLLGAAYGIRNGSGMWDAEAVNDHLNRVGEIISRLEDKVRLPFRRRRLYHLGLLLREVYSHDHFLRASFAHEEAADIASTEAKKQIERMIAAVERSHHACEKNDRNLFETAMTQLAVIEETHLTHLADTDDEVKKWLMGDLPGHRLCVAWLMGDLPYDKLEQDRETLAKIAAAREPLFQQGWHVYRVLYPMMFGAVDDLKAGRFAQAFVTANQMVTDYGHPSHVLFAILIAARAQYAMGITGIGRETLRMIPSYPSHGGHFVRAAARRELTALNK